MKIKSLVEKKVNVPVDEGTLSFIESKMYERNARRDLVAYALSMNMSMDTDSFKQYQKELVDFNREYDYAVNEMINTIVQPIMQKDYGVDKFNFVVNFEEGWVECTYQRTIDTDVNDKSEDN